MISSKVYSRWLRGSEVLDLLSAAGVSGDVLTQARQRGEIPYFISPSGDHRYDPEAVANIAASKKRKEAQS